MNKNASYNNRMNTTPKTQPKVISVLSGKGGVGKSTTAYYLARVLSEHGRVMLADADLLFGDLHIIGNVMPQCTVDRYLLDNNSFREPAIINDSLHLLASPSALGGELDIDVAGIVNELVRLPEVCPEYDFLIIDTPSGFIEIIAGVASISDIRLVSVMPDLTAISDGYGLLKYLKILGINGPHYLLPNRCRDEEEASFIYSKFAEISRRFLKIRPECLGYVYENHHLTARLRLLEKDAEMRHFSMVSGDFKGLARAILAIKPKPRKTKLFNRSQTVNTSRFAADIKG